MAALHSLAIAIALLCHGAPVAAQTSTFLSADSANAAQVSAIMAGTPYDMASAEWRTGSDINRDTFAFKVMSGLFMLGYQTEMAALAPGADAQHLRALHYFQGRNGLPVSNMVDTATLTALDAQLAQRELLLAPIAATFPLYDHMQPLHPNDVSRDTVAAIYALPMNVLPAYLQLSAFELIQCISGQCVGGIQDAAGTDMYAWFYEDRFIDPATSGYRFVGAYFDRARNTGRLPSAVVDVDTVLHEFAHYIDGTYGGPFGSFHGNPQIPHWNMLDTTGFYTIHYDLSTRNTSGCVTPRSTDVSDWISLYGYNAYGTCPAGQRTPAEDFAEAFTFYVMAGLDFRTAAAQRPMLAQQYQWLKTHVFEGVEYDTHLPQGTHSGCNDVPGAASRLPGWAQCDDEFVWDFTIPHGVVNGSCGTAHGTAAWTAPAIGLCSAGSPTPIGGAGPWSWTCAGLNGGTAMACAAPASAVPSPPRAAGAAAGDGQATVAFDIPSHDGGSPITGYVVASSHTLTTWSGGASPIVVSGLANGAVYSFTVSAVNGNGTSAPSAPSNTVQPRGPPAAPTIGVATPGNRQATVSFSGPASTGGAPITSYTVVSNPGGLSASGAVSPITLAGLTAGVSYTFTVRAASTLGTGPASAPSNSVVPPLLLLATENVDAATPPTLPANWQSLVQIQTNGVWRSSAGGGAPAGIAAHSGPNLLSFNAHTAGVNQSARLVTPSFSLAGVSGARASVWVYRDGDASVFMVNDFVEVYVATTTSLVGATKIGSVARSRWMSPAVASPGWYYYSFAIPGTFTGATNYVIFLGYSQGGGNDVLIDDITVATAPAAPTIGFALPLDAGASIGMSPGDDGGTPVTAFTATCTPAGGGAATTATATESPVQVVGLSNGTAYTCSVTATNAIGTSAPSGEFPVTPLAADARLAGLTASAGALSPAFASGTDGYTLVVEAGVTSVTLTATAANAFATIAVDGQPVASGTASQAILPGLGNGAVVSIDVTAQDGHTTATYTVAVRRAPSTNASLDSLTVTAGTLTPGFSAGTFSYSVSVPHGTSAISLVAIPSDSAASVTIDGSPVASGAVSHPIVLGVGHNSLSATVTAQDGTTSRTYVVDVVRAPLPAPSVHAVTPSSGLAVGGTTVTISGTWFVRDATTVTVGGVAATGVTVIDAGTLQAVTPSSPAGARDVVISTPAGSGILVGGFLYTATSPLLVTRSGTGRGTVTSTPAGISCGTACNAVFDDGTVVTLSATADSGSTFAAWSGACSGSGQCTVTVGATANVDAQFTRNEFTRYLAEGATSDFLDTRLAFLNYGDSDTTATLTFSRVGESPIARDLAVPAHSRATMDPKSVPGLAAAEFSTKVVSDQPLVVDRTMSWDASGYGGHAETAVAAPSPVWYLAEGATHSGFDLFYLLQNPAPHDVQVRVRYLRPAGAPLEKTYTLAPGSRTNIWVNTESFPGQGLALAAEDVSAVIETLDATPIIVERALYLSSQGRVFNAGHESAGVTALSPRWFLAEGATGPYFDLFVLIANPNDAAAEVRVTYLLTDGRTFSRTLVSPATSRTNIWVDVETFDEGESFPLADVAVSTMVTSQNGVPIIVERSLWWPGDFSSWHEAHNSAGAIQAGTVWALAEGEVGGSRGEETYILIANTSSFDGQAIVTLLFEDGTSAARTFALQANARSNVAVAQEFGDAVAGRRFGAVIASTGETPAQIVVERAMYWNAGGVTWAAGTNALATRLR